ncbi:MAG: hypothetical protein ACT4PS_20105 [Betaproteobacteria bacterium]
MSEVFDVGAWLAWFSQLDRTFIFLLVLPFVVAIVGLWAAYRDRRAEDRQRGEAAGDRESTGEQPQRRTRNPRVDNHRHKE